MSAEPSLAELQIDAIYELRDTIVREIIKIEKQFPGLAVVLKHQHAFSNPTRAQPGQLAVELRGAYGLTKATTFRSLKEKD